MFWKRQSPPFPFSSQQLEREKTAEAFEEVNWWAYLPLDRKHKPAGLPSLQSKMPYSLDGQWVETQVLLFFLERGFRLLARNYRRPEGELDLLMQRGETCYSVEVRARQWEESFFQPYADQRKRNRCLCCFQNSPYASCFQEVVFLLASVQGCQREGGLLLQLHLWDWLREESFDPELDPEHTA